MYWHACVLYNEMKGQRTQVINVVDSQLRAGERMSERDSDKTRAHVAPVCVHVMIVFSMIDVIHFEHITMCV